MKNLNQLRGRLWARAVISSRIPGWADGLRLARTLSRTERQAEVHLVLAAPGGGNIGDQAMLEALLEETAGPVVVAVGDPDQLTVPVWAQHRVVVLAVPHLLYGKGRPHRESLQAFGQVLARAAHLTVIGADVMDGRYSLRGSVNRAVLATAAARAGIDTRVIGFSWNSTARRAARTAVRAAGRAGVRLMLRDPISAARAEAHGIRGVERTADIVFAAREADRGVAERLAAQGRPLALVNASGLISAELDQVGEYARIVDHLRRLGLHVVLLPHVSRLKGDDLLACAAIAERVGPEDVTFVRELFTPAQIRGLTAVAAIVVTGRMHLAVMSLWNGTPAVALATQGKVEGLMELFETRELCVVPRPGFSRTVVDVVDRVLPRGSATRATIARTLPGVLALAEGNVSGLPCPGTAAAPDRQPPGAFGRLSTGTA